MKYTMQMPTSIQVFWKEKFPRSVQVYATAHTMNSEPRNFLDTIPAQ